MRVCVHASMRVCVHASMRVCVRASKHGCVRARIQFLMTLQKMHSFVSARLLIFSSLEASSQYLEHMIIRHEGIQAQLLKPT